MRFYMNKEKENKILNKGGNMKRNVITGIILILSMFFISCEKDYEKLLTKELKKKDEQTCIKLVLNLLDSVDNIENYQWDGDDYKYNPTEKTELSVNDLWKFHSTNHYFKNYESFSEWMHFYNDPEHKDLVTRCYYCNLSYKILLDCEQGYYKDLGDRSKYFNTCLKSMNHSMSGNRMNFLEMHFLDNRINSNRANFTKIKKQEIEKAKETERLEKIKKAEELEAKKNAEKARLKAERDKKREEERRQQEIIDKQVAEEMFKAVSGSYEPLNNKYQIIKKRNGNLLLVTAKNELITFTTTFNMNKNNDSYEVSSIYLINLDMRGVKQAFYANYNDPLDQFTMLGRFTGVIESLTKM